jgi:hypothetical protein
VSSTVATVGQAYQEDSNEEPRILSNLASLNAQASGVGVDTDRSVYVAVNWRFLGVMGDA